jgi:biotin operon repressor
MAIQSEAANRSSSVDPEKWLSILQRWHPREPREVLIDFINDLIEAAGPQRVERLDVLFVHTDETTRSAREKLEKLRRWRDRMRSDPWFWPQLIKRDRPVSVLVKKIVDESSRPLTRFEVERKFRRFRKVPATGLTQELKELANRGEIDRHKQGLYWRQGTASARYESDARRAYKMVYSAPDQRMREAELAVALGLSRRDTATLMSQLRKRGLFASATGNGFVVASAESLATLKRGPIFDGRGGIFLATLERPAPPDPTVFKVLRAERPHIDREAQAQKVAWLRTLHGEKLKIALTTTAKELGWDPADLAERLSKSAQRYLRKESARERWREEATRLMEQYPERAPKPLRDLFKDLCKDGLTRQIFKDVIREVAATLLREKGLKTSWSAPGAPPRG